MMAFVSKAYFNYLSEAEQQQMMTTHVPLGHHPVTQDVLLLPTLDRYAGSYVLGVQGTGKSGLLENMIVHDCEVGNAVVVVDPHGDLVDNVVHGISRSALKRTYVLDMADEAYPFGLNLFATAEPITDELSRTQVVDRIMHVFEVLWPDVLDQQNLPILVRSATITLLSNPGTTLVDMLDFFTDPAVRAKLVRNVQDPSVRKFWQTQFDNLTPAQQAQKAQPLVNRLTALFMGRSLVRNIVGQRETTINFRRAIEQKQIILVKLPLKVVPQDAALIGTILIAQLNAAVFSFGDIPQAERPGVSLYVDEFQNFATPDFASMFSEGRKFGMRVTLAHQYRNQLPRYLQDATKTARNKVAFQVNPDDAREAAQWFPIKRSTVAPEDVETRTVEYLLAHGSDDHATTVFIKTYLMPLGVFRKHGQIWIEDQQWDVNVKDLLLWGAKQGIKRVNFYVEDPVPYLNALFREVMQTRNPDLAIPFEAMIGFSNCGRKFFTVARNKKDSVELTSEMRFPATCVAEGRDGSLRWIQAPRNATEQFYHCIFHLRSVMLYLADHPLGKVTESTPADTARLLAELPRRTALVRSGDLVGMIQTDNTPPHATGEKAQQRSQHVREQTRAAYCRSRAQVERQFMDEPPLPPVAGSPSRQPAQTTTSRVPESFWEEV